jgi:acyl-CoA thioester hydrolase
MPPPADRTPFAITVTAAAADIDELGHVNNTVYLRWVQDVATAHWRSVALAGHIDRYIWVVTRHEIDYLRATLAGEVLTLTTWVGTPRGRASIAMSKSPAPTAGHGSGPRRSGP